MKNSKEWFSIKELMDENLNLPLPSSDKGIVKKAEREGWKKRQRDGVKGKTFEYHYSSFPEGVQKALGFDPEDLIQEHYIAELPVSDGINLLKQRDELVHVPFYNTFASAGFGAFNGDAYEPDDFVGLSSRWLQQRGLHKNKLAFILTSGDSMTPTIHHGDMLLINRAMTLPRDGQIYVIRSGDQLWVKRVQGIPGGIRLISDNKEIYAPIELMFEDNANFEVMGQVVFIGHDLI
jgi:uncharacterized HTH-type transcriptional regulator HI_1476